MLRPRDPLSRLAPPGICAAISSSILNGDVSGCCSLQGASALPSLQETSTSRIDDGGWRWQLNLPELDIPEPKPSRRLIERLDAYRMPNEGSANQQGLATEADPAVRRGGSFDDPPVRVLPSWNDKDTSRSGTVDVGRCLSAQSFVRPNLIELLSPAVQRPLLGPMISFGKGFYIATHVTMHSLVTAVVLRASRP